MDYADVLDMMDDDCDIQGYYIENIPKTIQERALESCNDRKLKFENKIKYCSVDSRDKLNRQIELESFKIDAVKKQIPKQVTSRGFDEMFEFNYGECPNCKQETLEIEEIQYCCKCGKAIKWEE